MVFTGILDTTTEYNSVSFPVEQIAEGESDVNVIVGFAAIITNAENKTATTLSKNCDVILFIKKQVINGERYGEKTIYSDSKLPNKIWLKPVKQQKKTPKS